MSKSVEVLVLPACNFCADGTSAQYDFRTRNGSWANACEPHYVQHRATDDLGTGKGQRLTLPEETRQEKDREDNEVKGLRESEARSILEDLLGDDTDAIDNELEDWGF